MDNAINRLPSALTEQLFIELCETDIDVTVLLDMAKYEFQKMAEFDDTKLTELYTKFLLLFHRIIERVRAKKYTEKLELSPGNDIEALFSDLNSFDHIEPEIKDGVISLSQKTKVPDLGLAEFEVEAEIPGKHIMILAGGGGGDINQTLALKLRLESEDKTVAPLSAVQPRKLQDVEMKNFDTINEEFGIIAVNAKTSGHWGGEKASSRIPEIGMARATGEDVYIILEEEGEHSLSQKIEFLSTFLNNQINPDKKSFSLRKKEEPIDTIIGLDTGGDCLCEANTKENNTSEDTRDLDFKSVSAINELSDKFNTLSCVFGLSIDSPDRFPEILKAANAKTLSMPEDIKQKFVKIIDKTGLGKDESVFSRTSAMIQMIFSGEASDGFGFCDAIPKSRRMSKENTWKSQLYVQPCMEPVVLMKAENHIDTISDSQYYTPLAA